MLLVTLVGLQLTGTLLSVPQVKGRKRSISHEYGKRGAICTCLARPTVDQPAILLGLHYDVIKYLFTKGVPKGYILLFTKDEKLVV